jgi:hypothetical protein
MEEARPDHSSDHERIEALHTRTPSVLCKERWLP